jgi:hypothetical protein
MSLAPVIGMQSCDVTATAIAMSTGAGRPNFVGLSKMTAVNNTSIGYDPTLGLPGGSNSRSGASIASNGAIKFVQNPIIQGTVILGPSGSYSGTTPTPVHSSDDLSYPATENPPSPSSGKLTISSSQILPGGTYVYDSISLANNSNLVFSGPTTLYVLGDIVFNNSGSIAPISGKPTDLQIRMVGSGVIGGSKANNVTITADIYGPSASFISKNSGEIRGSALLGMMDGGNNLSLYYDTVGGSVVPKTKSNGGGIVMVQ